MLPLLSRFFATPLRHPMNNKYHFRNITLVIWVQNSSKIADKNIPPSKNFLLRTLPTSARCQDLFFFRKSNFGTEGARIISLPRGQDFLSTALSKTLKLIAIPEHAYFYPNGVKTLEQVLKVALYRALKIRSHGEEGPLVQVDAQVSTLPLKFLVNLAKLKRILFFRKCLLFSLCILFSPRTLSKFGDRFYSTVTNLYLALH